MVRKLTLLMLLVAVLYVVWTVSVVGALAEAWGRVPQTPTAERVSPTTVLEPESVRSQHATYGRVWSVDLS